MTTDKAGRPRKEAGAKAAPASLRRADLDVLDDFIYAHGPERSGLATLAAGAPAKGERPAAWLAARRRDVLGALIHRYCSFAARHPVKVEVTAPVAGTAADLETVAEWLKDETERLTREAPPAVQDTLVMNRLKRMHREDPAAARRMLADMLEGGGDDG